MKIIKSFLIVFWLLSALLNFSPLHKYALQIDVWYTGLVMAMVAAIAFQLKYQKPNLGYSIIDAKWFCGIAALFTALLLGAAVLALGFLLSSGTSLSENRKLFVDNLLFFAYASTILFVYPVLLLVSQQANKNLKRLASVTLFLAVLVFLISGNRQFFFFVTTLLILNYYGKLNRLTVRSRNVLISIFMGIPIFLLAFSFYRLSYLDDLSIKNATSYIESFTGLECDARYELFCNGPLNFGINFAYLYLGVGQTGLKYAIDFSQSNDLLPIFSSVPVLDKILIRSGLRNDHLASSLADYIYNISGLDTNFVFINMFGAVALEFGLAGLIFFGLTLIFISRYIYKRTVSRAGTKIDFILLCYFSTCVIFGVMLFPFYEPFVLFSFLQLAIIKLVEISLIRPKSSSAPAQLKYRLVNQRRR